MDKQISTFTFQGWEIRKDKEIHFTYQLSHGKNEYTFVEKLLLPQPLNSALIPEKLLTTALNNVLLMLGISYWKLYCPKNIHIASFVLTKEQAQFWDTVYTKGLGEFFYMNKIDFTNLIHFPFDERAETSKPIAFPRENRSLLPLGGGKDSIVVGEILKKLKKDFSLITFYTGLSATTAQEKVSATLGKKPFVVRRELDQQLFILNKEKGSYNGHIPAVAIHSLISVFLAVIYDYRYVIFANESSANYGNVEFLGEKVNHQWSKSWEFEQLFSEYVHDMITPDITYFSLIRPFSELKIAELFSQYPQYFSAFVSCNKGFVMAKKGNTNWCGKCPKCAFVFLLLSAYLSKKQLIDIFNKNLFDDVLLLPLYRELLGLDAFKPFECVGTPEEVRLAAYLAWEKGEWKESALMQLFIQDVLPHMQNHKEYEKELFSLSEHRIPEEFKDAIETIE